MPFQSLGARRAYEKAPGIAEVFARSILGNGRYTGEGSNSGIFPQGDVLSLRHAGACTYVVDVEALSACRWTLSLS